MRYRFTRASLLLFVIVALHGLVTVATAQEIPKELWGNWRITKEVSSREMLDPKKQEKLISLYDRRIKRLESLKER